MGADLTPSTPGGVRDLFQRGMSSAQFTYDGDGKRVKSVINGETILFIGSHYEVKIPAGGNQEITKYYFAGSTRIALRKYVIPQSMEVEYILGDHLGSTSLTTDAAGEKVSEMRYTPWGEVRYAWKDPGLNTTPVYALTKWTFTGQYSYADDPTTEEAEDFGLMYFNARWMDPQIGRFAQADSIIPESVQGVQAWDRYAFANNSPIKYTDPSGHFVNLILGTAIGAIAGVGIVAFNAAIHPEVQLTAKDYAIAAGVGAAAGLLISTGVGAGAGAALGATLVSAGVGAGASAAGYTLASGADYNSAEMAANAGIGAVAGAASGTIGAWAEGASGLTRAAAIFDQAAISMNAGLAQQAVGNALDGNRIARSDLGVAATTGGMAYFLGTGVDALWPGGGRVAGPLARGLGVELGNNLLTKNTTANNNAPINWHQCLGRRACCDNP